VTPLATEDDPALDVLYVDNHLLAVRKPAGLPSVPDATGDTSLLDIARTWVQREFQKPGKAYLGVVQRLDRPVSGVLVFARTSKAASRLTRALRDGEVEKVYLAVALGELFGEEGRVEHWLRKDRSRNQVHVVAPGTPGAKAAETTWRVLARQGGRTLLELRPHTGRSHQLRVAAASLGAPLAGDLRYGASAPLPDRSVALHARTLVFAHPTRDERVHLECPLPDLAVWRFPDFG